MHRGHHETDAGIAQGSFDDLGPDHHLEPHLRQCIRRTRFRRQVPVAMFRDNHARTRHNKSRRGRDIQRAFAIAAGAHDVHRSSRGVDGVAFGAHHIGCGGIFIHRLAAGAQGHQEAADLTWGRFALEQNLERGFGLIPAQRAIGGRIDQRFQSIAHAGTFTLFRKFCSIWCP